jgi:hypothetical protein
VCWWLVSVAFCGWCQMHSMFFFCGFCGFCHRFGTFGPLEAHRPPSHTFCVSLAIHPPDCVSLATHTPDYTSPPARIKTSKAPPSPHHRNTYHAALYPGVSPLTSKCKHCGSESAKVVMYPPCPASGGRRRSLRAHARELHVFEMCYRYRN